ncbi:hypothetical protein EON66_02005 [archaeon]|nr:MAG: hypothetical protein EON66_02005 [archaeon]
MCVQGLGRLIGAQTLPKCKRGVRIINVAHGGLIDEAALLDALQSGHVAAAALDVFATEPPTLAQRELIMHPNVMCTPHMAGYTKASQVAATRTIAQQMADALELKAFTGIVNAANLSLLSRTELISFSSIAERLGELHAQLMMGKLQRVTIELQGPLVSDASAVPALRTAVLKGLLSVSHVAGAVSYLNTAQYVADLGFEVVEKVSSKSAHYTNLLTVTCTTNKEKRQMAAS